ncbi:hypothetical protein [Mesorhizobium sp. NZP2077]|nr:hypothetical protein [Mesorhizobium sp. NZP2077]
MPRRRSLLDSSDGVVAVEVRKRDGTVVFSQAGGIGGGVDGGG